jgi:predicted metal-dependent HD superfamily phosphohydrolase
MDYAQLLAEVKQETINFYHAHQNTAVVYHNLSHTERVVASANLLATHYHLNEKDQFIVAAAAWYHDAGYYINNGQDHEQTGAALAESFLKEKGLDEETVAAVRNCILATKMPQSPNNLLEKIVCDADLFHLGTADFPELNKQMRTEAEWHKGRKFSKSEWRKGTINFLENHQFQTDYGQLLLEPVKQKNIKKLKEKVAEEEAAATVDKPATVAPLPASQNNLVIQTAVPEIATIKKQKQEKSDKPERGIETMFRISSSNHQRLSDMADNKAHIMITTTSIIISVLISVLLRKLEDNPHLIIPTIMLLSICVVTMVFSILATRPSLPPGKFTEDDINAKRVNLLFFGNFYRMDFEDFNRGMKATMSDRDFLYGSLTRDVYSQGVVLGRKYRLLRTAYSIFMFGIIVSVAAFVIASFVGK